MKKLLLILTICLAFSCKKKDNDTNLDITRYTWPLQSATISPAKEINGKMVTDFIITSDNTSCLSNYTLNFSANGSFSFTSNGALCDMISYDKAKWSRNGNEIKLNNSYTPEETVILNGKTITQKYTSKENGITYTITYTFTAKSK
jgi:hypothetical protein